MKTTTGAVSSWLLVLYALGASALVACNSPSVARGPAVVEPQRATLEIAGIDDAIDPLARFDGATGDPTIRIEREAVNGEAGAPGPFRHYARIVPRVGESKASASERLLTWLGRVPLEGGRRFALEEVVSPEPNGSASWIGMRSFVVAAPPILRNEDVADAERGVDPDDQRPSVTVVLVPQAADRFAAATESMIGKRLAILVDGEVTSAPVVRAKIADGRTSITLAGNPAAQRAQADRLAAALRRH